MIISEDVFEHIRDYLLAFNEVYRVLKPHGFHVFTVPVHEGRLTISRKNNKNKVWHGDPIRDEGVMVVTDFGDDLPRILKSCAFKTKIYANHIFYKPEEITGVDATYSEYLENLKSMECYFKYNSIVYASKKEHRLFEGIRNILRF